MQPLLQSHEQPLPAPLCVIGSGIDLITEGIIVVGLGDRAGHIGKLYHIAVGVVDPNDLYKTIILISGCNSKARLPTPSSNFQKTSKIAVYADTVYHKQIRPMASKAWS